MSSPRSRVSPAVGVLFVSIACASPEADPAAGGGWVGNISTQGNVTTVINESGSVWTGPATLVEEASIGALEGEDPYLFGRITSITATANRILVADEQVPAVRMYDYAGAYLQDVGRSGEGPGEYRGPNSVRTDDQGRIFVRDDLRSMIHLYDSVGQHLETWNTQHRVLSFTQMTITHDAQVFTFESLAAEEPEPRRTGMQRFNAEGRVGELIEPPTFDYEPVRLMAQTGRRNGVRFPPQYANVHWTLDSAGHMIAGLATEYRFEIRDPGGATTVIEKYWEPVPVPEQERVDVQEQLTAWAREIDPEWQWEIPPIPEHKPAFGGIVAARSGELWVLRAMESYRMPECSEDRIGYEECWTQDWAYDVFEPSGRFLGTVPAPRGLSPYLVPHIDGDVFVGVVLDENETEFVKRYRLAMPD